MLNSIAGVSGIASVLTELKGEPRDRINFPHIYRSQLASTLCLYGFAQEGRSSNRPQHSHHYCSNLGPICRPLSLHLMWGAWEGEAPSLQEAEAEEVVGEAQRRSPREEVRRQNQAEVAVVEAIVLVERLALSADDAAVAVDDDAAAAQG